MEIELIEVAPGIDIERDILALMDFKPVIPRDPVADGRSGSSAKVPMDLRDDHAVPFRSISASRSTSSRTCSSSIWSAFALRSRADYRAIARAVEAKLGGLGRRVYAIVNYDNFSIVPELLDEYSAMVRSLADRFYSGVSRYTTRGFLRIKLGEALEKRGVAAHILRARRKRSRIRGEIAEGSCWPMRPDQKQALRCETGKVAGHCPGLGTNGSSNQSGRPRSELEAYA